MNFKDFITKIKETLSSLIDKITDFCQENKKLALIMGSLILVILITLIILICILSKPVKETSERKPQLILSEKLMIPDGPELSNEYKVSRDSKDFWTMQEANQWFSVPTQKDVEALEKENDKIINEILGAAP